MTTKRRSSRRRTSAPIAKATGAAWFLSSQNPNMGMDHSPGSPAGPEDHLKQLDWDHYVKSRLGDFQRR